MGRVETATRCPTSTSRNTPTIQISTSLVPSSGKMSA
jgi:hypothetical protein